MTVRDGLASTTPTTLQGLLALLIYINAVANGTLLPFGRPDNAFEGCLLTSSPTREDFAEQIGSVACQ